MANSGSREEELDSREEKAMRWEEAVEQEEVGEVRLELLQLKERDINHHDLSR